MFNLKAKNPDVAIEVGEGYAAAVKVAGKGADAVLKDYHIVALPYRYSEDSGMWADFKLDERFQEGIDELIEWLDVPKRLSLALPDTATRSFYLDIESDAGGSRDLREIIIFKIQKFAPISNDSTAVAYQKLRSHHGGGGHYLAVISSQSLVTSYERYLAQSGMHLGCIESAGLSALGLVGRRSISAAGEHSTTAIVRVEQHHFTVYLLEAGSLLYARTRMIKDEATMPARLAQEIRVLSLYSEDKLKKAPIGYIYCFGPGRCEDAASTLDQAGWRAEMVELNSLLDAPNSLLHRPTDGGKLISAVALATRE